MLAIPWSDVTPLIQVPEAHRPVPPRPGDRWRLGLYRIERPRPKRSALESTDALLSADEVQRLLGVDEEALSTLVSAGALGPAQEDGSLFKAAVARQAARAAADYQAWSPTYHESFHVPRRFGVLRFVKP